MNRLLKKQGIDALEKVYDKKKGNYGVKTGDPAAQPSTAQPATGIPSTATDGAYPPPPPPADYEQPPPPPEEGIPPPPPTADGAAVPPPPAADGAKEGEAKKKKGGLLGKVQAKLQDPKVQKKIESGAKTALRKKVCGSDIAVVAN